MKREEFRKLATSRLILLDGATGTELARAGMPADACPELWALEHPEILIDLQRAYREAGSDIVYACTFGANRPRLERFGLKPNVVELNRELVKLSRQAVGDTLVFGDIAPTGSFIAPLGTMRFEQAVRHYKEQVQGLLEGGVDGFVIETMIDMQEARAALLAIREICDLPTMVSINLERGGRALTGVDIQNVIVTFQALGADAAGCNCSTGPADLIHHLRDAKPYASVPLLAKPNAGMPVEGESGIEYDIDADEFADYVPEFVRRGVNILGGCCGTTPEYIRRMRQKAEKSTARPPLVKSVSALTSPRSIVFLGPGQPLAIIGERINPSGKKKLQAELRRGELQLVRQYAREQIERGANILDVNLSLPDIDQHPLTTEAIKTLSLLTPAPLSVDTIRADVLETALRIYPGRALVNSVSAETERLEQNLAVAAKYGAMFVALPMDDSGIPNDLAGRIRAVEKIFEAAERLGYHREDIVVDGLLLAACTQPSAPQLTLDLIEWATEQFKANTVVGLSNVSFGLPGREWINASFLSMALGRGLTSVIANPMEKMVMAIKHTGDFLWGRDDYGREYLRYYRSVLKEHAVIDRGVKDGYHKMFVEGEEVDLEPKDVMKEVVEDTLARRLGTS
jgi:5-methyltetrahydrofolate--homocysteine methyltransferase